MNFSLWAILLFEFIAISHGTNFIINGTIECENWLPWCFLVQLKELDSMHNDVIAQYGYCEHKRSSRTFRIEGFEAWDGVFDGHYELGFFVRHDCIEKKEYFLDLGVVSDRQKWFRREIEVQCNDHEVDIVRHGNQRFWDFGGH